jgi:teichuronic acid biosynthesis glycosyltransferase TuaC
MKLLTFSTLYPSEVRPTHGVFVENRLRHLMEDFSVESRVVAPVPWFPWAGKRFGEYGLWAKTPRYERRHGIEVVHPRYPVIPKVGMSAAPYLLATATRTAIRRVLSDGYDFDVVDAHYFYPDGVAAIMLGETVNRPVVITARGTDINLIPQYRVPRSLILWAAQRAAGLVTVCQALKEELVNLGVEQERITVLRNGVDLRRFSPPTDRDRLRKELAAAPIQLLSVGHLISRKGHDVVIDTLSKLPVDFSLWVAGEGPERSRLEARVDRLGLRKRVKFLGAVPHDGLAKYYGAADIAVLASNREGWANVLLEAMACGTAVVASRIWGTPEVVAQPEAGRLATDRTAECFAETILALLQQGLDRGATRRYAEQFGWFETSKGQHELFGAVASARRQ